MPPTRRHQPPLYLPISGTTLSMCWEKCYGSGGSGRLNNSKLFQNNSFNLSIKLSRLSWSAVEGWWIGLAFKHDIIYAFFHELMIF
ncbi:hypothetical protein ACS0TY_006133 [Phlomoides rotata]